MAIVGLFHAKVGNPQYVSLESVEPPEDLAEDMQPGENITVLKAGQATISFEGVEFARLICPGSAYVLVFEDEEVIRKGGEE